MLFKKHWKYNDNENKIMKNNEEQKILGTIIDNKLTFSTTNWETKELDIEIGNKISKWSMKEHNIHIGRSQFNNSDRYFLQSRPIMHEWALRTILNDQTSNVETRLADSTDICNHHRNIQTLIKYKITFSSNNGNYAWKKHFI